MTTHSGSPLPFMTAEATAAQPPIPQESQGIITRSKTITLGSATLLSPPIPPDPNPRGGVFQVEPSSPPAVAIPPQPGEMSSLASYLPTTMGIQHDTPLRCPTPSAPSHELKAVTLLAKVMHLFNLRGAHPSSLSINFPKASITKPFRTTMQRTPLTQLVIQPQQIAGESLIHPQILPIFRLC
jgi:hypothetical protein